VFSPKAVEDKHLGQIKWHDISRAALADPASEQNHTITLDHLML